VSRRGRAVARGGFSLYSFGLYLLWPLVSAQAYRSSLASRGAGRARSPLRARWIPWSLYDTPNDGNSDFSVGLRLGRCVASHGPGYKAGPSPASGSSTADPADPRKLVSVRGRTEAWEEGVLGSIDARLMLDRRSAVPLYMVTI
jgi:hypothetical protein